MMSGDAVQNPDQYHYDNTKGKISIQCSSPS